MIGPARFQSIALAADAPRRLLHALKLSPPLLLMVLTILALLLGMGTARAQTSTYCTHQLALVDDGPKWRFLSATCELSEATYDEFLAFLPERSSLVVSEISQYSGDELTDEYRQVFDGDVSRDDWLDEIQPLFDYLYLSDEQRGSLEFWGTPPALLCDDDGVCRQSTYGTNIVLRFVVEDSFTRLVSIRVEYLDHGC